MSKGRRIALIILIVLAVIFLAADVGVVLFLKSISNKTIKEDSISADNQKVDLVYNGENYVLNDNIITYLFLGIDKESTEEEQEFTYGTGGQADALYLVVCDTEKETAVTISIPRDTMTRVQTLNYAGESLGYNTSQICLAHSYGDGKEQSCEMTAESVSYLLYGVSIDKYYALDVDSLVAMAGVIGDVTVTVPNDILSTDMGIRKGDTVVVNSSNADQFLRGRNCQVAFSAMDRLENQQAYLTAAASVVREMVKNDSTFFYTVYSTLEPYATTNVSIAQFVKLMSILVLGEGNKGVTIPGTYVEGAVRDEFYADDDELYKLVVETFYTKIEDDK